MLKRLFDKRGTKNSRGGGEQSAAALISSLNGEVESEVAQAAIERELRNKMLERNCGGYYSSSSSSSSSLEEDGSASEDDPAWITVDDGKGGLQHIPLKDNDNGSTRVQQSLRAERSFSVDSCKIAPLVNKPSRRSRRRRKDSNDESKKGIKELLWKELSGRHFFSMEPTHETSQGHHLHSRRIVSKKGLVHTERSHVSKRKRRYLSDFFNTMLDIKWRYVLFIFTLSFFLSWFAFAVVWYVIMWYRGDFEPDHLPDKQAESGWTPCVLAIHNFASAFLFSVETQHTIGYGSRQTTERCPEAIFMQSLQSVIGVMIQACMVGTIFAKLSRPKKRAQTLMFTKNAVVCQRDGKLCLVFRVGNMRYSHLVEAHVRAVLINKKVTEEGEVIPYHQTELKVGVDMHGEEDTVLFLWPTTVVHCIDEESPFYNMTATDLLRKRYEVVVVLEGIVEPTGMSIQARSSYMPNEILWGYRFVNVLNYRRLTNQYKIDYSSFNKVYKVDTPRCSAKQMDEQSSKEETPERSPTVVTVIPTPTSSTPRHFNHNAVVPYHQSQAALLPPFSSKPTRGLTASNHIGSNPSHQRVVSHLSLPCLQHAKVVDSNKLHGATSAQLSN